MREKTLQVIVTFQTHTDAQEFAHYAKQHGIPGRLIPVPSAVSVSCGICWRAPQETVEIMESLKSSDLVAIEAIYTLLI